MPSRPRLPRRHALDAGMSPGHELALFTDPHLAWAALLTDLDAAKQAITIDLYMLRDDEVGQAFEAALSRAVARGVAVRLTLDGVGSLGLSRRLELALLAGGVRLRWFNRLGFRLALKRWTQRNHHKVFVIDGRIAWVQGMNVTTEYYALTPPQGHGARHWADAAMRARGPLVAVAAAKLRAPKPASPDLTDLATGATATAAFNRGGLHHAEAHRRYLQAALLARESIYLAQAYFLPELALVHALVKAAEAGLTVRVVIPSLPKGDVVAVSLASMHAIGRLLRRGVRVFEMQDRMMHAKFGIVDGVWWTLGSANLDPLSRQRNKEANVAGVGETEAQALTAYFEQLCSESRELTHADWLERPLWLRVLGRLAWAFRALL